jgi:hypothetical protein
MIMIALAPRTVQNRTCEFEPRAEDGLAARFEDSGTDEPALATELRIAHPVGILGEGVGLGS